METRTKIKILRHSSLQIILVNMCIKFKEFSSIIKRTILVQINIRKKVNFQIPYPTLWASAK